MQTIHASNFGILPRRDISLKLAELMAYLKNTDDEKTVIFEKGEYYINSENCERHMMYITNTVGDGEFKDGETPHLNTVAFCFNGIHDLTFDGGDSVFIIDGKVTNAAIENCKSITLKNIELRHAHPDMHEMKVVKKGLLFVDFEIDRDSEYEISGGKLYFFGKDFRVNASENTAASWIGLVEENTPDKIVRVRHPLFSSFKAEPVSERTVRVHYPNTRRFKLGDRFYLFDVRRQFVGIFMSESENIRLENIRQRFNYSLAIVAQNCENIEIENCTFAPEEGSARKMASVADFIQLCMCRGKISVKNNTFCGAGDDCLNVHGIHFIITDKSENKLTLRFMHSQTHGFDPIRVGDTVAYIDPDTLLEVGTATVISSELLNEYEISVAVDNADLARESFAIEDVSACPTLDFINNEVSRIITRGLLITTRGTVNVESNHFVSTSMSGILLSDDAKSWYESGMCKDVTVKGNKFDYCGEPPILIKPENIRYNGGVHKNIKIIDNAFMNYKGECIKAESTDNLCIRGNLFAKKGRVKTKNCNDVLCD